MKLLVVAFLLIATNCFADVTAEIIGKDIDENGNIVIKTRYVKDGVEVESRYPRDAQGRSYWVTRYSKTNFGNMTDAQILDRIDQDIKAYADVLITRPIQEQLQNDLKTANYNLFTSKSLDIVGHKVTKSEAVMLVDTDFDGKADKQRTVKSDSSFTDIPYTAPAQ